MPAVGMLVANTVKGLRGSGEASESAVRSSSTLLAVETGCWLAEGKARVETRRSRAVIIGTKAGASARSGTEVTEVERCLEACLTPSLAPSRRTSLRASEGDSVRARRECPPSPLIVTPCRLAATLAGITARPPGPTCVQPCSSPVSTLSWTAPRRAPSARRSPRRKAESVSRSSASEPWSNSPRARRPAMGSVPSSPVRAAVAAGNSLGERVPSEESPSRGADARPGGCPLAILVPPLVPPPVLAEILELIDLTE